MAEFNSPYDVGLRALMHVGSPIIANSGGAFPGSPKAQGLLSACYGKLRRAELQRNLWSFSTRRAALRAIDFGTMLLAPTLWSSSATYFDGSIVVDANNTMWLSKLRDNSNNQPGAAFLAWEPYFGPTTASFYNSTCAYYTGELVYTAAGDGTYNVFQSSINGNAVHPALPNQWSTQTFYFKDNVVQVFPAWSSGTTYSKGQTVVYTDGNYYSSLISSNLNNIPASTINTDWALMPALMLEPNNPQTPVIEPSNVFFQPSTLSSSPIAEWSEQTTYAIGSFVIFNAQSWLSLQNNNTGNFPNVSGSSFWVEVTGGTLWMSLIDLNLGNNPANTPATWSSGTTYTSSNVVAATDGYDYTATAAGGNLGQNPANNANPTYWTQGGLTPWTSTFTQGGGNPLWLQIGGAAFPYGVALTAINLRYPVGSGPAQDLATRNVFRLPANYLRRAPEDPKAGVASWLGAPGNLQANDWLFEGNYLITMQGGPIVLRFVADVQNVQDFKDMFCEMLACSIGEEICEPLTQSTAKLAAIWKIYQQKRSEAIIVDEIEIGVIEPPLDDLIACRL